MLSTAADALQLASAAPWLAVGVLSLVASAWVYRQTRRAIASADTRASVSAARQGKRIGELEKAAALLDLRRRQVEWVLLEDGLRLPYWPADGPEQPRPRTAGHDDDDQADDDQADDVAPLTEARRLPVPPLPADVGARHRRTPA